MSAVSLWRSDTPISDSGRLPVTFPPERKFRRATVRRPAFRVMPLLRSSSTAYVIPPTCCSAARSPYGGGRHRRLSPRLVFRRGRGRASEGSTSITGYAIVKVQKLIPTEKQKSQDITSTAESLTYGGAPTSRSYILAFLSGVFTRIAQRYKLNSGDRELRFVSPTSIRIIHALLQFVNR